MSENLDLVRSICADWERGDFGTLDWADEAIEFVNADELAPATWVGRAELVRGSRAWLSAWADFRMVADRIIEVDRRVLVLGHVSGRGKTSNLTVDHERAAIVDIKNGKVRRFVVYTEQKRALADLGLEE
jgi:ketosteroid isomerase-like protein